MKCLRGPLMTVLLLTMFSTAAWPGVPFAEHLVSTNANGAHSIFGADLDGDGDTDLVAASRLDGKIAWWRNNGDSPPSFTEFFIGTSFDVRRAVGADLEGDGDVDVLIASALGSAEIAWFENDGGSPPGFTKHVIPTTDDDFFAVVAGDVDGDGDIDAVSVSVNDNRVAWYENDGGSPPGWTERFITSSAIFAWDVDIGDIDGDGDLDALSASLTDNKIAWYENDGASPPGWTEHPITTSLDSAHDVRAADLDDDGDLDVSGRGNFYIEWYENDGGSPPSFAVHQIVQSGGTGFALFDLDEDGDVDLLGGSDVPGRFVWYENDGCAQPTFLERVIAMNLVAPRGTAVADVDRDGDQDVLLTDHNKDWVLWYENISPEAGLGGAVDCMTPRKILCQNMSTGDQIRITIATSELSWDCEEAGLVVNPGDRVQMRVVGEVN